MTDVVSVFNQVRQAGDGWTARCPAHEDARSSLSIGRGAEGRWLLKCHAGCSFDAIVAAVGLTPADLFVTPATMATSRIVSTYDYHDEGGRLLFQVVRFEPKDFRQRCPDGKGWTWKLGTVRRVLYRLPDLQGKLTVYIVEGEKDADRLHALGFPGTTNAGGAGKWRPEYVRQLQAASIEHIVVLPDNDDAGRKHAADVARTCHAAGLVVKVVTLPGLPPKGDVSDWLDAGHTKDDLLALVKATPRHEPNAEVMTSHTLPERVTGKDAKASRSPIVTFLSSVQPETVDWLWPGRFARGKYTLVSGEPGLGKTYLMIDCAARISRGGFWPDGARAPQGRVLYLTAEDGLADTIRPRFDALGGDPTQVAVLEAIRERDGTRASFSLTRDLEMLAAAIREVRPLLVVMDPINAYLGKVDTHRDSEVRAALAPLIDLVEQGRCTLAAIGHLSKDAQRAALHRPGGSIAFVAAARLVLALAADPTDANRRLLAPLKANLCKPAPVLAYRIGETGPIWETEAVGDVDIEAMFRPSTPADREDRTDAEALILELLTDVSTWPMNAKEALAAASAHGIHERTMRRAATRLGVRIERMGFGPSGKWLWHRPIADTADTAPLKPISVSPMSAMTNHQGNPPNNNIEDNKTAFPRTREGGEDGYGRF